MRFQSASSWSFSYEVCRRPRANAPRVPRRRSDFPPASCGASARASARREAHRRVASPPAPIAISERSPAVLEMSVPRVSAAAAAFGDSQPRHADNGVSGWFRTGWPIRRRARDSRVGFGADREFPPSREFRPRVSRSRQQRSPSFRRESSEISSRRRARDRESVRRFPEEREAPWPRSCGSRSISLTRRPCAPGTSGNLWRATARTASAGVPFPAEPARRWRTAPRSRARPAGASRHALARRAHAPGVGVPRPGAAAPATHTRVGRAGDRSAPFGGRGG